MPVRLSSPIWYSTCVGVCHTLLRLAFFKIAPRHCERPAAFRIKRAGRSKRRAGGWAAGKTKAAGRSGWSLRAADLSGARGCVCSTIHLLARVKDPQNFNDAVPHAVGQYVWVSGKDQFSRPGDTPRATGLRCGEHGGHPASIHFCHGIGLTYVSCSGPRVPIARLAAAQAQLMDSGGTVSKNA